MVIFSENTELIHRYFLCNDPLGVNLIILKILNHKLDYETGEKRGTNEWKDADFYL